MHYRELVRKPQKTAWLSVAMRLHRFDGSTFDAAVGSAARKRERTAVDYETATAASCRPRRGADEGERGSALTTARLTGCGATVIRCSGAGLPPEGSVPEGFADHVEPLSKVITYTPLRADIAQR